MKKILAACAIVATAVLGFAAPASAAGGTVVSNTTNPEYNKPSYWQGKTYSKTDTCYKKEFSGAKKSVYLDHLYGKHYTLLVLKAGTQYTKYDKPSEGKSYYPANYKDVSFAIYCVDKDGYGY